MKLQNMTVIFIIIMIPIIIVTSYYIGLQIKTITMQKDYTVKLQTAAKDSIQALEINTVEWNSNSANLADSKRRDVLASINTFTTSLANSMGIGGAGKGRIQTYIPAIVYTMYDGYYIYSASLMQDQDTTKDGLTQFENDGTIKSNGTSYQYILKPYSPYSARYVSGNTDITVNYTLDNYIRVYGTVNGEYQAKEGYLVVCDDNAGVKNVESGRISEITYRGATIKPETLTEQVYTVDDGKVKKYSYIYDQYDNKLYWDNKDGTNEDNYFSVDKNNNKVYLQTALPEGDAGFSITNRFRKISIPMYDNREDEWTVQKVFQILNPGGEYKFYYENQSGAFVEFTNPGKTLGTVKQEEDYSAINYCVESYVFTKWVNKYLKDITVKNIQSPTVGQYNNVGEDANIFAINSNNNNPDPENDGAYATSVLAQHKKDIIINTIEKNLSQATEQAKKMNPNYEYRLPQLSYDEWEQALSNISIIAFMQGMPIGLKYYNNYAIATSTLNKEFVDPDELYFAGAGDQYYHQRQCNQATGNNYIGYRSIDYIAKSYEVENDTTKYYYPHANGGNSELECYYCLVNRSTYKLVKKNPTWTNSYYNALARERYMQLDEPGTYKPNVVVGKKAETTSVEYGGTVKYTITIKNNGIVEDTVNLLDFWDKEDFDSGTIKIASNGLGVDLNPNTVIYEKDEEGKNKTDQNGNPIAKNGIFAEEIKIGAKQEKTLEYTIKVKGKLGEPLVNTAAVYSWGNNDVSIAEATETTTVKKTIKVAKPEVAQNYNIVMVLDHSLSLIDNIGDVYEGVATFLKTTNIENAFKKGNSQLSTIHFNKSASTKYSKEKNIENIYDYYNRRVVKITLGGTNYNAALIKAKSEFEAMKENSNISAKNVLIFFTDGAPTGSQDGTSYTIDEEGKYSKYGGLWLNPIRSWKEDAKEVWDKIKENRNNIKKLETEIYCINFGSEEQNKNAEYGLKNIISSYNETKNEQYYAKSDNLESIKTAFESISSTITSELDVPDTYTTANNKLELKEADKIQSIKIGESVYGKAEAKEQRIIIEENGKTYLNLEKVEDLNQEITIIY
jgi:hypothetical protein